jgi:hypothetical protein
MFSQSGLLSPVSLEQLARAFHKVLASHQQHGFDLILPVDLTSRTLRVEVDVNKPEGFYLVRMHLFIGTCPRRQGQ